MTRGAEIELNRTRSIEEILRAALDLYRRYPLLFLILAAAVMVPYDLIVLAATGRGPFGHAHESLVTFTLLTVLSFSLISPLISALHVHAVILIGNGQAPKLAGVAAKGLRVLPVVSAAEIVATLGIYAGILALIVPGILLGFRWTVVAQSAAVEHDGWSSALRRSGQLTKGNYGHIFGLLLVLGALGVAVRLGVAAIPAGSTSGAGSVALGVLVDTVIASFGALTMAVLYFDLLAREAGPQTRDRDEYQPVRDLD